MSSGVAGGPWGVATMMANAKSEEVAMGGAAGWEVKRTSGGTGALARGEGSDDDDAHWQESQGNEDASGKMNHSAKKGI